MTSNDITIPVLVRFLSDWHVGTGDGRVGVVDALVRRDRDGLPYVPAKTLLGVWRDACETVAATFDTTTAATTIADAATAATTTAATITGDTAVSGTVTGGGTTTDAAASGAVTGGDTIGPWTRWVRWLFGSQPSEPGDATAARRQAPSRAALSLTPVRMPEDLRAALRDKPELVDATVLLRPGVALGPDTGTAVEDMLRLEERGLRGTVLHATATVHGTGHVLPPAAELLLRAGARLVDGLGGKRNRGNGRLVLSLDDATAAGQAAAGQAGAGEGENPHEDPAPDTRLVALLADVDLLDRPGIPPQPFAPDTAVLDDGRRGHDHRKWRLELEVLTPVVVVDRVVGNNITTRPEIPGTTLLPVVLAHLPDPKAVGLDDLRVGDAVPAVVDDDGTAHPALPSPLTWQRADKGQGRAVVNIAVARPDPAARFKPSRKPAARVDVTDGDRPRWREARTGTTVSTHAVVNDVARRPMADAGGGLFSYHGITPGTVLVSDLVLPAGKEPALVPGQELRLGRSRKDDFGRVRVRRFAPLADGPGYRAGDGNLLRVWLTSDVLLRDERLAPDPSPERLGTVLGRALGGTELTVVAHDDTAPLLRPTVTQTVRRDGFAPRWGRHRGSLIGLRAGSVVTFRLPDGATIDPVRAAEVERDGVGDRTVEGYGRVLLDPPELRLPEPVVQRATSGRRPGDRAVPRDNRVATPARPPGTPQQSGPEGLDTGTPHPIELAAWRRNIRRRVARVVADPRGADLPDLRRVSRAQRGVLRDQVARLARPGGDRLVQEWLESMDRRPTERTVWDPETRERLNRLLLDGTVWENLGLDGNAQADLVLAPDREDLLRQSLAAEAITVLVDELARQAQAEELTGAGTGAERPDLEVRS